MRFGSPGFFLALAFWGTGASAFAQPANDNFADRQFIAPDAIAMSGSLSNATSEPGEPLIAGVSSGQTAWWSWTAPSNGILTLSVEATNFSPLLEVYQGDELTGLSLAATNIHLACYQDKLCGCHWRTRDQTTFHVVQGQSYPIAVDSAIITDASLGLVSTPMTNADGTVVFMETIGATLTTNVLPAGVFRMGIQFTPAPANDDFDNAVILSGSRKHLLVSNAGAGKEGGEPDHLGNPGGSSVWYSWTCPASGRVTLSTNEVPPYLPPSSQNVGDGDITVRPISPFSCGDEIDQNPLPVFYPIFAGVPG